MKIKGLFVFLTVFALLGVCLSQGETNNTNLPKDKEMGEKPPVFDLQEIVVTGTKSRHILKDVPVETSVITRQEIEDAGIQIVADALKWMPGLDIGGGAPFGGTSRNIVSLRGLPAQYSLVLMDGQRTKSEHVHTGVNLNLIPVDMVERIEVVKGPASALYGSEAFGGVINIITKPIPDKPRFTSYLSYGSFDTRYLALGHSSKFRNFGYLVRAILTNSDGVEGEWSKQKNVLAKMTYPLTKKDMLSLNTKYYRNNYHKSKKEVNDDRIDLVLDWKRSIGKASSVKAEGVLSRFTGEMKNTTNTTTQANVVYQGSLLEKHLVTSGVEARHEDFERVATPHKSELVASAYLQDEIEVIKPLNVALSLRLDSHPRAGTVLTPKGAMLYKLTKHTNLRSSVGRGFRAPSLQDLYEYHYNIRNTFWRDGNPDLKPEYSLSYNLGIEHTFLNNLLARCSVFRNDFSNMIEITPTGRKEKDGRSILERRNIKTAFTQGAEVEIRYAIADLMVILGHTFLDTGDDKGDILSYNPQYSTSLRLRYDAKKTGSILHLYAEDVRGRYYKDSKKGKQELEDYILLNLNLTQKIIENVRLFFRVSNILDEEFTLFENKPQIPSLGRTFTGGIKANF